MATSPTKGAAIAAKTSPKSDPKTGPKSGPTSATKATPPATVTETALSKADGTSQPGATIPDMKQADLKKKDLIDQVVVRSGIKKKDAKPVVEAMLAILGETLGSGRDLNLPPMGKLRINRTQEKPGFRVIISKLRQSTGARIQPDTPLAEPTE